jgi:hypothetical protein
MLLKPPETPPLAPPPLPGKYVIKVRGLVLPIAE